MVFMAASLKLGSVGDVVPKKIQWVDIKNGQWLATILNAQEMGEFSSIAEAHKIRKNCSDKGETSGLKQGFSQASWPEAIKSKGAYRETLAQPQLFCNHISVAAELQSG